MTDTERLILENQIVIMTAAMIYMRSIAGDPLPIMYELVLKSLKSATDKTYKSLAYSAEVGEK